jgi:hypothetical protein
MLVVRDYPSTQVRGNGVRIEVRIGYHKSALVRNLAIEPCGEINPGKRRSLKMGCAPGRALRCLGLVGRSYKAQIDPAAPVASQNAQQRLMAPVCHFLRSRPSAGRHRALQRGFLRRRRQEQ